jgi:hypothetical protein
MNVMASHGVLKRQRVAGVRGRAARVMVKPY